MFGIADGRSRNPPRPSCALPYEMLKQHYIPEFYQKKMGGSRSDGSPPSIPFGTRVLKVA